MGSMLIRNIPDDVLERFKARAKANGKSAEQLGREAIAEKAGMSKAAAWDLVDSIRAQSRLVSGEKIIDDMRRDRAMGYGSQTDTAE